MIPFTSAEQMLIDRIEDKTLSSSLIAIRNSASDIWSTDSPRLIENYTDHGLSHSQRIIYWITELLKSNGSKQLSDKELYILLLSAYLHDIGMQCDIKKHEGIIEIAITYGAKFNYNYRGSEDSKFTIEEQNELRLNHQYITAAWIDCAYQEKVDTSLNDSIKSVPDILIDDLIDVCLFHSKLAISNCDQTFKYHNNERKQLIASLLRLADELDIDAKRVNIATVKNFNINPINAVYWYLHNSAINDFEDNRFINIIIRLNPKDFKKYNEILNQKLISDFRSKNRSIFTILAKNSFYVMVGDNSRVVEDKWVKEFPSELEDVLNNSNNKSNTINEITREVCTWLRAIHYEICNVERTNDRVEIMEAVFNQGPVSQHVIVECVDGSIIQNDMDHLDGMLSRKHPEGWIISDRKVSGILKSKISNYSGISLFTFSDFLKQKIWGNYNTFLQASVEKDKIEQYYINHSCHKLHLNHNDNSVQNEEIEDLETYAEDWLYSRGKIQLSILGSFGSGKTWFCKYFTYKQLSKHFANPTKERLPILIKLRGYIKSTTIQQLIYDALVEQYNLPFFGSTYSTIEDLNRQGKLLFILDGFDEMARQVDNQTIMSNYKEISKLVTDNSKVILTSRTEYFKFAKEVEDTLGEKFELVYLNQFDDNQVITSIKKRLGPTVGKEVARNILSINNLSEMIHKPLLMELLLSILDEQIDIVDNPSKVFLYSTNKLILRNIQHGNSFTSTHDKLYFLCELAWEMIKSGNLRIHYKDIPERIKHYFNSKIANIHDIDYWDYDLRSQTLLHRDVFGYYEFAHKSIAEYFVAYKFSSELGVQEKAFENTYSEAEGDTCKTLPVSESYEYLGNTFGLKSLFSDDMNAVARFFIDIIDVAKLQKINKIIENSIKFRRETIAYVNGNLVTSLWCKGVKPSDIKFSNSFFLGAVFVDDNFENVNLTNATFSKSFLSIIPSSIKNVKMQSSIIISSNGVPSMINDLINVLYLDLYSNVYAGIMYKDISYFIKKYPEYNVNHRVEVATYTNFNLQKYLQFSNT